MRDVPLVDQPVYQQLDWQWTLYGLTFKHLGFAVVPGSAYLGVVACFCDDFAVWPAALIGLVCLVGVATLQVGRDVHYLRRTFESCLLPASLSPFAKERRAVRFPLAREAVQCRPA